MKIKSIAVLSLGAALFASCNNKKVEPGNYVDLNTGDSITVIADPATGYAMNAVTKKPVYLYVDAKGDTVFTTGQRVNKMIIPLADGKYEINAAKVKVEDPAVKVSYADYEKEYVIVPQPIPESPAPEGPMKIKEGDYKKKVEKDGDIKIKTEDTKTKIEDGKAVTKPRKKIL